jgi:response regulator RpfG family c-di-GMP phosphodiesterase
MTIVKGASSSPCVLYIDDERPNLQAFHAAFRTGFKVLLAHSVNEAWELLKAHDVHVVIADQRMPGLTGSEVLAQIRQRYPQVRRMLITAYADIQAVVDALNNGGACFYIQKPWEVEVVRKAVFGAYAAVMEERSKAAYTAQLVQSNQQLEFALRQRLLS